MPLALLQAATNAPSSWNEEVIAKATIVIAVATVLYLIATVLLWLTTRQSANLTRDMFEASHRPYVTVFQIQSGVPDLGDEEDERDEYDEDDLEDEPPERIFFQVGFKNVGSVPAHDFRADFRVVVDGRILPLPELAEEPVAVLFPDAVVYISTTLDEEKDIKKVYDSKTISITIECTYKGVGNKEYRYEEKANFDEKDGEYETVKVTAT